MKKQEKLDVLSKAIKDTELCRCSFCYGQDDIYFYPDLLSKDFFISQEEDEFILDGYTIRKISHIKKIEIDESKIKDINKKNGVTLQVKSPKIDLTSWQTIFNSLKQIDTFLIIEDEKHELYAIGKIIEVMKNKLIFHDFDMDGKWSDNQLEMPYTTITTVKWETRYDKGWKEYLESDK